MALKSILLGALTLISVHCFADEARDEQMWKQAYNGNFSLTHKMSLTMEGEGINDEILKQFVMAYVYHRMDKPEEVAQVIKGIDNYLEYHFNRKQP